ncbi:MAG: 50S ribosomal protein L13 [Patescibacteria group bacterium]|jgi:large subunit ribosomal protein L13
MTKQKKIISINAAGKVFGRLASEVAALLRGKREADFAPNIQPNIFIEIEHINQVKFTGKKMEQKKYHTHSQYPGGYKAKSLFDTFTKNPEKTFLLSVQHMLPSNKLRKDFLKHISFR